MTPSDINIQEQEREIEHEKKECGRMQNEIGSRDAQPQRKIEFPRHGATSVHHRASRDVQHVV